MKKRFICLTMVLIMLCAFVPIVQVNAENYGDYLRYEVNDDNTVTITKCDKSATNITIPSTIDSKSVTGIGDYAFEECKSLKNVSIPNSVTSIGHHAFYCCSSLTSISIPNSVISIGDYAFFLCNSLKSISIPNSVISIGDEVFVNHGSLESINVDTQNMNYCSQNGVLFNKSKTELVCYPAGKTDKSYTIPNSVTSINNDAFDHNSSLTSISIPNSVTSIGESSFNGCSSLTSISIPSSVTTIGSSAFSNCSSLTSISVPDSVTRIGGFAFDATAYYNDKSNWSDHVLYINNHLIQAEDGISNEYIVKNGCISISDFAFSGFSSLTDVRLPNTVTTIGEGAFRYCRSLKSINIPSNVISIGSGAFYECNSLAIDINIPNGVTSIGRETFWGCDSLTYISIPSSVTSIGDEAFRYCGSLTSINIPNGITSIGSATFQHCSSLKSVNIPNSVTSIGDNSFGYCESLASISLPNSVTSIDSYAFSHCSSLESISIPSGVTRINIGTFYYCESLTSISIPISVMGIDYDAFSITDLQDVYYGGTEEQWMDRFRHNGNYMLSRATIHYNIKRIPKGTLGNTNSTSKGAPIITSAKLTHGGTEYDIFNQAVTIEEDSDVTASIEAVANNNGCKDVKVYITQGVGKETDITGVCKDIKPGKDFSAGKTIYIMAVDTETGKSTSKATKLKVSSTATGSLGADSGVDGLNFKIGKDVGFTIPDSVPVFGGTDISWGFDFIPISVEYDKEDDNKINVVFGMNLMKETREKDGVKREFFTDFDFKSYKKAINHAKRTQKHSLSDLRSFFDKDKGIKKNMSMFGGKIVGSGSGDLDESMDVAGYAEMKYIDGSWQFVEGELALNVEIKYTYQGQIFIWVVPLYYEFGGGVGAGIEGKMIDVNPKGFSPQFEAYLSAKIMAEIGGGVGIAKVATAGASGEGSLNIKTALFKDYVKSWGEGSASFNVKVFGKKVAEKEFARGDFLIYETGNSKGLIKDKNAVTLQSVSDSIYDTIDINSIYENESRDYANAPTEWVGDEAQITLMSADYTNKNLNKLASNIYTEAKPQICEVDGKKIMVMQWDNTERTDVDRTMLVYSVYDDTNGTWSAPVAVDDDGTADFYSCFKDGYLVWQNEKTTLTDDMTLKEIAELGEICVTKWNGNGFDEAVALTDDNTLDTQPSVSATTNGASVVWTTNTEGDILGITGKNNIMRSDFNGTLWSTPQTIKSNLNSITNITAGTINNEFAVAYVVDDDNDLNTIDDRDIRIIRNSGETQLTNNDVIDSNPVFADNKIYYYSEGNISYSDIDGTNQQTVFDEAKPGLTDSFVVDSNANGDTAIWWTKAENGGAEVYASLYTDNAWSDEIRITSVGNKAKYPSGILNDNGSMIVAFNGGIMNENEITQTDLYTIAVNPSYDIEITDAYFDEDSMTAYATVKNSGELEISSYTVAFTDNNSTTITEPLKAGESADMELTYNKLQDLTASTIELTASIEDDEYNTDNNTVSFEISHADIVVDNAAVNEAETVVSADISNTGYTNAQNVTVSLRDGSAEGSVIATKTMSLAVGDEKSVTFDIDKSDLRFMDATKTLYITASIDEDEVSLGNNDSYALITSASGYADYEIEVLDYNEIDGKYVINSVARNNTSSDVSCKLYTAVYSSNGTLKGCGSVDADIDTDNDTGVDIAISCEIEETDVIKTFMWSDTMTPLAKSADLIITE